MGTYHGRESSPEAEKLTRFPEGETLRKAHEGESVANSHSLGEPFDGILLESLFPDGPGWDDDWLLRRPPEETSESTRARSKTVTPVLPRAASFFSVGPLWVMPRQAREVDESPADVGCSWPFSWLMCKETWTAPADSQSSTSPPSLCRSFSAPVLVGSEGSLEPLPRAAQRIIEGLFLIGTRTSADCSNLQEPVLCTFPSATSSTCSPESEELDASARMIKAVSMASSPLDALVLSFVLPGGLEPNKAHLVPGTPFVFTLLPAVLGSRKDGRRLTEQPLFCTALRFEKVSTGSAEHQAIEPYACCLVSRHPFLTAFSKVLLDLQGSALRPTDGGKSPWASLLSRARHLAGALEVELMGPPVVQRSSGRAHTLPTSPANGLEEFPRVSVNSTVRTSNEASLPGTRLSLTSSVGSVVLLPEAGNGALDRGLDMSSFAYCDVQVFSCPPWANVERLRQTETILEFAAKSLFEHLAIGELLQLATALLLEQRVLVVSKSIAVGSSVVLGLSSLLWPFAWPHLMLPVCPFHLQDVILDAPVPFLCALPEASVKSTPVNPAATYGRRSQSRCSVTGHGGSTAGAVICYVEAGKVVWRPEPGSAGLTTLPLPPRALQQRRGLLDDLLRGEVQRSCLELEGDAEPRDFTELYKEFRVAMSQLARTVVGAARDVRAEIGSQSWLRQMEARLCDEGNPDSEFFQAFLNTQTCLMFLSGG